MDNIIRPKSQSILEQAESDRINKKVEQIKKLSEKITEKITEMIFEADIDVKDFPVLQEGIRISLENWYKEKINARKLNDFISKE